MKIYEKIKKFIKEYYKTLLVYIIIFCIFIINLPYYISSPGGLIDTSKKIIATENFKLKGSLNMTYVSEMHATIPTYIWALINKDWDIEKESEVVIGNESTEDMEYRNHMLLIESNKTAELVAYKHSDIKYEINNNKVYITYIDALAKTDLKIQDQIIKVDDHKVIDKNYLYAYINSKNIGDKITFVVSENGREKTKKATLIDVNGEPKVGALITEDFDIKSNKKIKFNFEDAESGPSGGLMLTLTIYSNINKIDLTNGNKVAGTGTIDADGNVGEISGIKYKLIGAVNKKADIFLVPNGDNYKEAKKLKEERGYSIDIVPIESFEEALKYLNK